MKIYVQAGYRNLDEIRNHYNQFSKGGNLYGGDDKGTDTQQMSTQQGRYYDSPDGRYIIRLNPDGTYATQLKDNSQSVVNHLPEVVITPKNAAPAKPIRPNIGFAVDNPNSASNMTAQIAQATKGLDTVAEGIIAAPIVATGIAEAPIAAGLGYVGSELANRGYTKLTGKDLDAQTASFLGNSEAAKTIAPYVNPVRLIGGIAGGGFGSRFVNAVNDASRMAFAPSEDLGIAKEVSPSRFAGLTEESPMYQWINRSNMNEGLLSRAEASGIDKKTLIQYIKDNNVKAIEEASDKFENSRWGNKVYPQSLSNPNNPLVKEYSKVQPDNPITGSQYGAVNRYTKNSGIVKYGDDYYNPHDVSLLEEGVKTNKGKEVTMFRGVNQNDPFYKAIEESFNGNSAAIDSRQLGWTTERGLTKAFGTNSLKTKLTPNMSYLPTNYYTGRFTESEILTGKKLGWQAIDRTPNPLGGYNYTIVPLNPYRLGGKL